MCNDISRPIPPLAVPIRAPNFIRGEVLFKHMDNIIRLTQEDAPYMKSAKRQDTQWSSHG
jgi:hypothetical protein